MASEIPDNVQNFADELKPSEKLMFLIYAKKRNQAYQFSNQFSCANQIYQQ